MPSLKDLKNRIESVKSTRKITKAMQMVAAAKLRRAQESAEAARPYAERMTGVLSNIAVTAKNSDDAPALLKGTGNTERHLLVVCTSERGLCGGFNTSIVKLAKEHVAKLQAEGKKVTLLCVGKKGREQLKREYEDLFIDPIIFEGVKRISYGEAEQVADVVLHSFDAGEYDVVTLFYSEFKSVISQIPTALQLVPASIPEVEGDAAATTQYEYEPDENALLADLLPKNVTTQIFRALLENAASEQGARMSAMDNATRNAGEMVDKLSIQYNRSRQAAITSELIEIISGAEAL
jgi:F-type H+-transporting ATPase subunit gamma